MNEKKIRPKSQIMMANNSPSASSSVSLVRDRDRDHHHHNSHGRKNGEIHSQNRYENEWEIRERELLEAKARTAQMEKTMRWWSDTTEHWKEKWSQARKERNQAREELKLTKTQMDQVIKESQDLKKRINLPSDEVIHEWLNDNRNSSTATTNSTEETGTNKRNKSKFISKLVQTSTPLPNKSLNKNAKTQTDDFEIIIINDTIAVLEENIAHLTKRLEDANRIFIRERQDKLGLIHTIENMQRDFSDLQELYDGLKRDYHFGESASESMEKYFNDAEDDTDVSMSLNIQSDRFTSTNVNNHEYENPRSLINKYQKDDKSSPALLSEEKNTQPKPLPNSNLPNNDNDKLSKDSLKNTSDSDDKPKNNYNDNVSRETTDVNMSTTTSDVEKLKSSPIQAIPKPKDQEILQVDEDDDDEDEDEEDEESSEETGEQSSPTDTDKTRPSAKQVFLENKAQSFSNDNDEIREKEKKREINGLKDSLNSTSI